MFTENANRIFERVIADYHRWDDVDHPMENPYEADGKTKRKDVKNPDKALRNVPVDQIVLVKGLKYDAESKSWGGAKIYDPTKGLKVNATAEFETADKLKLRGTILGMGVTLYWVRIKK